MTDLGTRTAPALRRAAPALLGYAAVRALGLLALALWSAARDKSAYTLLTARWDALWYTRVAELGYGYEVRLPNGDVHSNLAFFPLLPWLERLLSAPTPLSYADAGFVISLLASLAAAWGVFAVADHVYGRRAGVCAVLLWAVLPVGIVQSMAYSESLFTALAAWSLYAVLTGRWLTAGLLAALAGLTRPVGLAVVAAVWAAGITAFLRDRQRRASLAAAPAGRPSRTAPPEDLSTRAARKPTDPDPTSSAQAAPPLPRAPRTPAPGAATNPPETPHPAREPSSPAPDTDPLETPREATPTAHDPSLPTPATNPHGTTPAAHAPGSPRPGSSVRIPNAADADGARVAEPAPTGETRSAAGHTADGGDAAGHKAGVGGTDGHTPGVGDAAGHAAGVGGAEGPTRPPRTGSPLALRAATRRALGMAVAPLGAAGYVLWVGHRTGKGPLGYLDVQAGWRNGFDGGYAFARFVGDKFTSFPAALAGVGLIVGVGLVVWLYVTCVRQGQPLPLLVYAGVVTALALCASSYFGSKPRLLMPAFPLLLPLALALSRARTRRSAVILGSIATTSALYGAFWLNGSGPP
ncbi:hypothetical protein TUSST3_89140 [Streptomyces sp. TUS-ST3]|uniref:mannosyltransferase family protein n=1 Tax=Streptomyces sp. TUS-ST3 TaxID=3025591 RepID=UPI00235B3CA8|nr:mannosyltransferase family protein [Streptomyces sp. TUS-ST3]GLP72296.1 hypothetical protein TUSST3_89140 [Streptomyces sp. TUS-ST3]